MELDELSIQHGLPGRPESPTLERTARKAVEAAMRDLVQEKLLYQKVTVDLAGLAEALTKANVKTAPEKIAALQAEISVRPWRLETHHMGDDPQHAEIHKLARTGGQAIGTPIEQMNLHFYAPSVRLACRVCKTKATFIALMGSHERKLSYPFPRATQRGIEHIYTVFYRCETCREVIHASLIRREGIRLHLCGFAPRREQAAARSVPKSVERILCDASNAVAEGDVYAGFYHLRTMIEHYIKVSCGIPLELQMRGEELISKHNSNLPIHLRSALPSLAVAYEKLSIHLHARTGDANEFSTHLNSICDHIEGVALLNKYAPQTS